MKKAQKIVQVGDEIPKRQVQKLKDQNVHDWQN
jgi:hypothetical protein